MVAVLLVLLALALFGASLVAVHIGRRVAQARLSAGGSAGGIGPLEATVFSLFGLFLAFSFNGAMSRWDDRRHLIVDETNAIGTAYLRVQLMARGRQDEMKARLRDYTQARIDMFGQMDDSNGSAAANARASELQKEIWPAAIEGCKDGDPDCTKLLLPALNEMFDIATARADASRKHPPWAVFALLMLFALVSAFLAGQSLGHAGGRSRTHVVAFAALVATSFWLIMEVEFPRRGLVRLDAADVLLVKQRDSMR